MSIKSISISIKVSFLIPLIGVIIIFFLPSDGCSKCGIGSPIPFIILLLAVILPTLVAIIDLIKRKIFIISFIVIIILLAIFSFVVFVSISPDCRKTYSSRTVSEIMQLRSIQEMFWLENNRYANTQEELIAEGYITEKFKDWSTKKELTDKDGYGIEGGDNDPQTWSVTTYIPDKKKFDKWCRPIIEKGYWYTCGLTGCYRETEIIEKEVKKELAEDGEIDNWLTYRNEEYKFEVKYPNDWEECSAQINHPLVIIPPILSSQIPEGMTTETYRSYTCMYGMVRFGKMEEKYSNLNDLKNYFWNLYENIGDQICKPELMIKKITFNEYPALQVEVCDPFGQYSGKVVHLVRDQEVFNIEVSERAKRIAEEKIIKQILSTFRFIETEFQEIVTSTEVIQYIPTEIPSEIREGYCWVNSISAPRKGAWRCMIENSISDPCFVIKGSEKLVCEPNPITGNKGFLLKLTQPLPEDTTTDNYGQGWGWLIQLEDGTICRFLTGATAVINNERVNYYCSDESFIVGDLETGTIWKAKKVDNLQSTSTEAVSIKRVWQ